MHSFDRVKLDSETDFTGAAMADLINFDKIDCVNLTLATPIFVASSTGDGGRGFMKRVWSSAWAGSGVDEQIEIAVDEEADKAIATVEEKTDEVMDKTSVVVDDAAEKTKGAMKDLAKIAAEGARGKVTSLVETIVNEGAVKFILPKQAPVRNSGPCAT
jgi:hypothetical protein